MFFSFAHSSAQLPMCWFEYGSHRPSTIIESAVSSGPILVPLRELRSTCGAFHIDSMPPATPISISPAAIARATPSTASSPEPHTLLTVTHGTLCGRPANRAACRAGAWPTPAGSTMPMCTSPTASGGTPARSSAALIAVAPRRGAETAAIEPRKLPMGVRAAPTMTTSRMPRAYRQSPLISTMSAGSFHDGGEYADHLIDFVLAGATTERKPHRFARLLGGHAEAEQDRR